MLRMRACIKFGKKTHTEGGKARRWLNGSKED